MTTVLKREFDRAKTQNSFKKVVRIYDYWSLLTESKASKIVLELANIKDNEDVLEVACGTGTILKKIVQKNPNGRNVGVDISSDMLCKARKKLENAGLTNYELIEGDAINLNYQDNSFGILVNNYMVDLLPEESFGKIANEFYRVLKTDGTAIVSTFSFGKYKINKFWYWLAKNFPDLLTGCRPVSFKPYLINAGFTIEHEYEISQNTFPSKIIKAKK